MGQRPSGDSPQNAAGGVSVSPPRDEGRDVAPEAATPPPGRPANQGQHSDASSSERLQQRLLSPLRAGKRGPISPLSPQSVQSPEEAGNWSIQSPLQGLRGVWDDASAPSSEAPFGTVLEPLSPTCDGIWLLEMEGHARPGRRGRRAAASLPAVLGPRDILHKVRAEMMHLEECVPWTQVRKAWRTKRSAWRRGLRSADTAAEVAKGMREFRQALVMEGCDLSRSWEPSVEDCVTGMGSHTQLLGLWSELHHWVAVSLEPKDASHTSHLTPDEWAAVQALKRAALKGDDCLTQVPLELMLDYSSEALAHVKAHLQRQRRLLGVRRDVSMYSSDVAGCAQAPELEAADCPMVKGEESADDSDATLECSE